jgi:hypothetical protein
MKDKISLGPQKVTRSKGQQNNNHREWRKQLDLPRDVVTQDEAIVFLLAKELSMLDI